jgi:hypothetical protein
MAERQKDNVTGQFIAKGDEPIASKITFRVPKSLRSEAEQLANGDLASWLRQAMINEIERQKDKTIA